MAVIVTVPVAAIVLMVLIVVVTVVLIAGKLFFSFLVSKVYSIHLFLQSFIYLSQKEQERRLF